MAEKGEQRGMVSLVRCRTYESHAVERAVRELLEPFGGMGCFVRPGERVALKPNLLRAADPESAIITHPSLVEVIAGLVRDAGGIPLIIDSPGASIPYTSQSLRKFYDKCGYLSIRYAGCLNYDCRFSSVPFNDGKALKRFDLLIPVLEADRVINLPKVKTHGFTYFTCGVKNLFGVVPGLYKSAYHGRFQDKEGFCRMLVDLAVFLKPCLTLCDGIVGMEGDGPAWGRKKRLGLLAASENPFSLDMVISHLIGFDPRDIPYIRQAIEEGLCPEEMADIPVVSREGMEGFRNPFERPASCVRKRWIDAVKHFILLSFLCTLCEKLLIVRPRIDKRVCRGCAICARGCPRGAIRMAGGRARITRSSCIQCYCCQELCPHGAVYLKRPLWDSIRQGIKNA